MLTLKCSVPQGSVLGLLIYVNDFARACALQTRQVFFIPITTVNFAMNDKFWKIAHLFNANKLSLNIEKTKYTFFY